MPRRFYVFIDFMMSSRVAHPPFAAIAMIKKTYFEPSAAAKKEI